MAGWGAVAQIGTDIASSALQAHLSLKMQSRAFHQQNKFYRMRYQRTMADMRLAGLNPILAYRQGAGAGTPAASGGGIGGTPSGVARDVHSSLKFKTELKILEEQRNLLRSQQGLQGQQAGAAAAAAQVDMSQAKTIDAVRPHVVNSAQAESRLKRADVPLRERDRDFYKTDIGEWTRYLQRILHGARGK